MPTPDTLTHYYRPCTRPLLSVSSLSESELAKVLEGLAEHEPLSFRLTQPSHHSERLQIERRMRERFLEKGGQPQLDHPHYFVLGEFALWEGDGSRKVQIPLAFVPSPCLSFTMTDSFFNYRANQPARYSDSRAVVPR